MARALSPIVLILGQDSLRADRALDEVLNSRNAQSSDVVRIWGDEASFPEVFVAATSRSLFSDQTVVVVRRAEKLRGGGGAKEPDPDDVDDDSADEETPQAPVEPVRGRKAAGKPVSGGVELPELDSSSTLILVTRKVDRRIGVWKKISKMAELIDADYLKGRFLISAAAAEARTLGLRLPEDLLRDIVEQSGPSLGRIVSELEKILLFAGTTGRGIDDILAVTSSPPLYRLSDAIMSKNKTASLELLDEALRQGEAGLRILATAHGTVRKLAVFRALRQAGLSSSDAGTQAGILPFKVADTERAARGWSTPELSRAFGILAEADRRLKLSAPAAPLLTHALACMSDGGRA